MSPKPARHTLTKRVGALETRMQRVEGALVRIEPELQKQTGHLGTLVDAIGQAPNLATGSEGTGLCGTLASLEQERRTSKTNEHVRAEVVAEHEKEAVDERAKWDRRRAIFAWVTGSVIAAGCSVVGALHYLGVF